MDENLIDFEQWFIPLLKAAKERGLTYRVEQCPMPGWTTGDIWHNNIAYAPGPWIALHRICEKHGVGDNFRIHYDPSHAVLMGQDTRSIFQYLKDEGYNFLIGGFHVKGQVVDAVGWSAWGSGGQTMERGDWKDGKPSPNPADQANAWKKQVILCEHELPGTARHDPLAYLQNRTVDWLDHQLAARELLKLDVANTHLVVEHEYPKARIQDKDRLKPILQASIAFVRHIDEAAACMYALQHEVLESQKIPIQGRRPAGLQELNACQLPTPNFQLPRESARTIGVRVVAHRRFAAPFTPLLERSPWELGVGGWELCWLSPCSGALSAGGAESKAEPTRHRVAAYCGHDHYRRIQPPRRAWARAVRQVGAVRPRLVSGRRRLHDHRAVHESDVRGPGTARRQVFGLDRAGAREMDRHLQQAGERLSHPLPGGPGRAPA